MHALFPRVFWAAVVVALVALAAIAPASALAGKPTIERVINNHFTHTQHFELDLDCGPYTPWGVTEIATGNEHLVIVDQGESVHITYVETFKVLVIPDDPTVPSHTRHGAGALSFNLIKDGTVETFHESFHDFGPAAWDPFAKIRMSVTFVYRDGDVVVDHELVWDGPPPGC